MNTTTATLYTGCVITPADFSHRTTDVNRNRWTRPTIQCVIDALEGALVVMVTDTQTGSTSVGRLLYTQETYSSQFGIVLEYQYDDEGHTQRTAFTGFMCGAIIPLGVALGEKDAKWKALDLARERGVKVQ